MSPTPWCAGCSKPTGADAARSARRRVERRDAQSQLFRGLGPLENLTGTDTESFLAALEILKDTQTGFDGSPLVTQRCQLCLNLGLSLQDSLSNFAAGVMILIYRPFDVGDMIEAAGVKGEVDRMSLVSTTILTIDNQTLIVPNSKIWGDVIRNMNAEKTRRIDLLFGIGYDDSVDRAEEILRSLAALFGVSEDALDGIIPKFTAVKATAERCLNWYSWPSTTGKLATKK